MRANQLVILSLAASVILSATQFPFAATMRTRADYGAAMATAAEKRSMAAETIRLVTAAEATHTR